MCSKYFRFQIGFNDKEACGETEALRLASAAFPRPLAVSWIRNEAPGTCTGTYMNAGNAVGSFTICVTMPIPCVYFPQCSKLTYLIMEIGNCQTIVLILYERSSSH